MLKLILVPIMLTAAGALMSFAWIGHLRFRSWGFATALVFSWLLVLPEYLLNVYSSRWGLDRFSGAQMASIHLGSGIVAVALISAFFLGERISSQQIFGFGLLMVALALVLTGRERDDLMPRTVAADTAGIVPLSGPPSRSIDGES